MKIFLFVLLLLYPVLRINSQSIDTLRTGTILPDTTQTDTTTAIRDSLKLVKARPVIPLFPAPLLMNDEKLNIITRRDIIYNDYRYAGDLLDRFPLSFQRTLGILGQPHELMIYGNGFNNVSYMIDGLSLNNRYTNSLDLNYIQSEAIDSIEIIPSPRAFLYGSINNPASVNFIPRENYSIDSHQGPYSRMRYYQAPNEEAMIDAIYRTYLARRLVGIFEMTNYSAANKYPNTNHGSWKFRTDLNYLLSDQFNIKAGYNYNRTETRLFGGIVDTIEVNQDIQTPVNNPTRYQKFHQHQFNVILRNKEFGPLTGKIDLYYINTLRELRENEIPGKDSLPLIFQNDKYNVYGALLNQNAVMGNLELQVQALLERISFRPYFRENKNMTNASFAGRVLFRLLNNKLFPSVFAKYLEYDSRTYYGIGGDVLYSLNDQYSLYAGLSKFSRPGSITSSQEEQVISTEAGVRLNLDDVTASLNLFNQSFNNHLTHFFSTLEGIGYPAFIDNSTSGIGLEFHFKIWNIHFESHSAYYMTEVNKVKYHFLPEYSVRGKVYYQDTLFNQNLFLKTGISTSYTGMQDYYYYLDSWPVSVFFADNQIPSNLSNNSPSFVLNYFLIGEIRRRAVIYFTIENIFDKKQNIVPGYPLPSSGMRLGVSWEFLN